MLFFCVDHSIPVIHTRNLKYRFIIKLLVVFKTFKQRQIHNYFENTHKIRLKKYIGAIDIIYVKKIAIM